MAGQRISILTISDAGGVERQVSSRPHHLDCENMSVKTKLAAEDIARVKGYRFSARTVGISDNFIQTIKTRTLRYSRGQGTFAGYIGIYSTPI